MAVIRYQSTTEFGLALQEAPFNYLAESDNSKSNTNLSGPGNRQTFFGFTQPAATNFLVVSSRHSAATRKYGITSSISYIAGQVLIISAPTLVEQEPASANKSKARSRAPDDHVLFVAQAAAPETVLEWQDYRAADKKSHYTPQEEARITFMTAAAAPAAPAGWDPTKLKILPVKFKKIAQEELAPIQFAIPAGWQADASLFRRYYLYTDLDAGPPLFPVPPAPPPAPPFGWIVDVVAKYVRPKLKPEHLDILHAIEQAPQVVSFGWHSALRPSPFKTPQAIQDGTLVYTVIPTPALTFAEVAANNSVIGRRHARHARQTAFLSTLPAGAPPLTVQTTKKVSFRRGPYKPQETQLLDRLLAPPAAAPFGWLAELGLRFRHSFYRPQDTQLLQRFVEAQVAAPFGWFAEIGLSHPVGFRRYEEAAFVPLQIAVPAGWQADASLFRRKWMFVDTDILLPLPPAAAPASLPLGWPIEFRQAAKARARKAQDTELLRLILGVPPLGWIAESKPASKTRHRKPEDVDISQILSLVTVGTLVHSTDVFTNLLFSAFHTTDGFLLGTTSLDHLADTLAYVLGEVQHLTDALNLKETDTTHITDTDIFGTIILVHQADVVLAAKGVPANPHKPPHPHRTKPLPIPKDVSPDPELRAGSAGSYRARRTDLRGRPLPIPKKKADDGPSL